MTCWGVKGVNQHAKYLGLPTIIGRSKKQIFAGTMERVIQKMKDWKEKPLSQAGKEVLIKFVIQSILTYVMNCFFASSHVVPRSKTNHNKIFLGFDH